MTRSLLVVEHAGVFYCDDATHSVREWSGKRWRCATCKRLCAEDI